MLLHRGGKLKTTQRSIHGVCATHNQQSHTVRSWTIFCVRSVGFMFKVLESARKPVSFFSFVQVSSLNRLN